MASCIYRRDEVRAWRAWHDKPTLETRAELDRQKGITFRYHVLFAGVLFAGMAVVPVPVALTASRRKNSGSQHRAQEPPRLDAQTSQ